MRRNSARTGSTRRHRNTTAKSQRRQWAAIFFWGLSLLALLLGVAFAWFIKDGLGPNAVETHGLLSLRRFWDGMIWALGLYVALPLFIGCLLYPWRRRPA